MTILKPPLSNFDLASEIVEAKVIVADNAFLTSSMVWRCTHRLSSTHKISAVFLMACLVRSRVLGFSRSVNLGVRFDSRCAHAEIQLTSNARPAIVRMKSSCYEVRQSVIVELRALNSLPYARRSLRFDSKPGDFSRNCQREFLVRFLLVGEPSRTAASLRSNLI